MSNVTLQAIVAMSETKFTKIKGKQEKGQNERQAGGRATYAYLELPSESYLFVFILIIEDGIEICNLDRTTSHLHIL